MRCIHIYRGAPQLGGIKLHKHFPWFHTAKWGVHRIVPRTVLHVIRIVLTMELQPLKTVELHGWVCLPDSLVRNGSTSTIGGDYKRTHTHKQLWIYIPENMYCSSIVSVFGGDSVCVCVCVFLRMRPAAILLLEGAATIPRLLGMGWSG